MPCEQSDMKKLPLGFNNCLASPEKFVKPSLNRPEDDGGVESDGEGSGEGGGRKSSWKNR